MTSAVGVNELDDAWVWEVAVLRMKWFCSGKSKKNLGRREGEGRDIRLISRLIA